MSASTYDLLRSAIRNKQQVFADYNNHYREFCPHAIGTKGRKQNCIA